MGAGACRQSEASLLWRCRAADGPQGGRLGAFDSLRSRPVAVTPRPKASEQRIQSQDLSARRKGRSPLPPPQVGQGADESDDLRRVRSHRLAMCILDRGVATAAPPVQANEREATPPGSIAARGSFVANATSPALRPSACSTWNGKAAPGMAGLWFRRDALDAADRGLKIDACALRAALGTVSVDFAFDSARKLWHSAASTPGLAAASNRLRIDHAPTIGVAGLRLQRFCKERRR